MKRALLGAAVMSLVFLGASVARSAEGPPSSVPITPVSFDAVYVVNGGDGETGSISVINAETNRLAGTIVLTNAMWPHHVYASSDGRRLAVAVPGMDLSMGHGDDMPPDMMGAVMLLDARTGTTLASTMLPMMNHNAIFSPNGREIWTSQMMMDQPGMVQVLDASTLQPRQEIEVGEMPAEVTFSPAGFGYVANGESGTVSVIDPARKQVVNTIPVGENPVGAWQANNGFAYVDNEDSMTLSAIDRRAGRVAFTYDLGFMPGMAKLGPDGNVWVTNSDDGSVVLYRAYSDQRVTEIATGDGAHGVTFSGNGRTAYITNQMANTVSVIDIRTRRVITTVSVGEKPNGLLWRAG